MKRLGILTVVAALATMIALPANAQERNDFSCQAQYDQSCVWSGWMYGRDVTCGTASGSARCYSLNDLTTRKTKGQINGMGWYYPIGYNSWKRYPAYFDGAGWMYVQARCKTGNMGTTYAWARDPHGSSFPDPNGGNTSTVPTRTFPKNMTCPP